MEKNQMMWWIAQLILVGPVVQHEMKQTSQTLGLKFNSTQTDTYRHIHRERRVRLLVEFAV